MIYNKKKNKYSCPFPILYQHQYSSMIQAYLFILTYIAYYNLLIFRYISS